MVTHSTTIAMAAALALPLATLSGCYQGLGGQASGGDDAASGASGADDGGTGGADDGDGGGDDGSGSGSGGEPEIPFTPMPRVSALAKIKDFVVGLPPTDAERQAYLDDPSSMSGLVDAWMATPEYESRTLELFHQLFQQDVSTDNLAEYFELTPNKTKGMNDRADGRLLASIPESFAQTAIGIVRDDRPFTEVLTTRTFMLNVPQMVLLAYLDAAPRDDVGDNLPSPILQRYPDFTFKVKWTGTEVPIGQTLNPNSANFMTFWLDETPDQTDSCLNNLNKDYTGRAAMSQALQMLFRVTPGVLSCATGPVIFTDADWELRPVTVRMPMAGEDTHEFFDLPSLRTTDELVLSAERVGFFTTLGFSANWITNDSNQHRVNANQTLIVALGRTFDPANAFTPADGASVDQDHAQPGTTCYICHQNLDPLRDFLRQSYTYSGAARPAAQLAQLPAEAYFSLDGDDPVAGTGVGDMASIMAASPRFAGAWTERLCYLFNAGACDPDDPELARVAQAFVDSNFDWNTLIRELASSPAITFSERTSTWEEFGEASPPVSQDRFCRRMTLRLRIPDACNLAGELQAGNGVKKSIRALADGVPPLSFGRSAVAPFVASEPDVFSVASIERICQYVAEGWLGEQDGALYGTSDREAVLDVLVGGLMALPASDPRAAEVRAALSDHWDAAVAGGATPVDALRSTFITGCASAAAASTSL